MEQRIIMAQLLPEANKAMYALTMSLAKINLAPIQKELLKIRASQINGCAFCIDMHTKDAIKHGETPQRIFLLNAWREAGVFTNEEKMLLAITEEVTLISQKGLTADTYTQAEKMFGAETLAQIIMSVVVINAWNRIAISTLMPIAS